ncbi:hypothetical protein DSM106972_094500 [Dulcicalothrix desertica PCC 7102]|uniref:Uncharacterized protein n=1 Tax=Dulcicalothrix desertica PCC 7102 TaxID=232991 RepID=A0A3S1BS90_9CYAN|nr:hypothetical protein [Dulcicalothrix desertica]RUS93979.1 hypothetical protein DSM106972_094500 [Dulcicalothrix desertica PCC 7102]TWH62662.1 hypothetical protein CAL7102_00167 [Dulcicalothrix desertica PCC 7102]
MFSIKLSAYSIFRAGKCVDVSDVWGYGANFQPTEYSRVLHELRTWIFNSGEKPYMTKVSRTWAV